MLARCCQLNETGHVFSLENGEEYAEATREHLERFGLSDYATVIHAPLMECQIGQQAYLWYEMSQIPDANVDMLVIDGPPGFIQKHSRYPALPVLFERLSESCAIFMEDAARPDEQEITERWLEEFPSFVHEYKALERGCSIFRMVSESAKPTSTPENEPDQDAL